MQTEMQPVARVRKRVPVPVAAPAKPDPNGPPPIPAHPARSRWPNGSAMYRAGGGLENHYGWRIGDKVWRRTGPEDEDIVFLGTAPDTSEAFLLFKGKTWADVPPKGRARASRQAGQSQPPEQ